MSVQTDLRGDRALLRVLAVFLTLILGRMSTGWLTIAWFVVSVCWMTDAVRILRSRP